MQARAICCSRPNGRSFLPTNGPQSPQPFSGLESRRKNFWLPPNGGRPPARRVLRLGERSEVRGQKSKAKKPEVHQLSNTASNLSGFAALRETFAIQGGKEVFTLRREGAKKAF